MNVSIKKSRAKCHARLVVTGVDIYAGGEHVAGITEREAIQLMESLFKQAFKIRNNIKRYRL